MYLGDQGDKFYIILKGKVSVQLPYYVKQGGNISRSKQIADINISPLKTNLLMSPTMSNGSQQNTPTRINKNSVSRGGIRTTNMGGAIIENRFTPRKHKDDDLHIPQLVIDDVSHQGSPADLKYKQEALFFNELLKNPLQMRAQLHPLSIQRTQVQITENDSHIPERYHTEVRQLFPGQGFGELALLSSKPRAATIRTLTPTTLATVNKADYLRVLAKIEDKAREERIQFLGNTPYFQGWSRAMILKVMVSFHPKTVIKDQTIIQEGEKSAFMYLIREGEFELVKRVRREVRVDLDYGQFVKKNRDLDQQNSQNILQHQHLLDKIKQATGGSDMVKEPENQTQELLKASPKKPQQQKQQHFTSKVNEHRFMYLGKGQVFGEECMLLGCPALYTLRCTSSTAQLLVINELEFGRRIRSNEATYKTIERNCDQKAKEVAKILLTNNSYINQSVENRARFFVYEDGEENGKKVTRDVPMEDVQNQFAIERKEVMLSQQIQAASNSSNPDQVHPKSTEKLFSVSRQDPKKLIKQGNHMLNQQELDFRETMREIVNHYPCIQQQRRIVRKEYHSKVKQVQAMLDGGMGSGGQEERDPLLGFQEALAQTLSKSTNKRELINILKRKLVTAVQNNPQDHLRLLDKFLQSKTVKRYTQAQKKHYVNSKITEAIEKTEGLDEFIQVADMIKRDRSVIKNRIQYMKSGSNVTLRPQTSVRHNRYATWQQQNFNQQNNPVVSSQMMPQNQTQIFQCQPMTTHNRQPSILSSVRDQLHPSPSPTSVHYLANHSQLLSQAFAASQLLSPQNTRYQDDSKRVGTNTRITNLTGRTATRHQANLSMVTQQRKDKEFSSVFKHFLDKKTKYMSVASTITGSSRRKQNSYASVVIPNNQAIIRDQMSDIQPPQSANGSLVAPSGLFSQHFASKSSVRLNHSGTREHTKSHIMNISQIQQRESRRFNEANDGERVSKINSMMEKGHKNEII